MNKIIISLSCLLPIISFAQERDALTEIDGLKKKITSLEKQISKDKHHHHKENIETSDIEKITDISEKIKFGGQIEFDTYSRKDTGLSRKTGAYVGTAKVKASGNINSDLAYKLEYDLKGSKLKKAYIDLNGIKYTDVRFGRFSQDFGISSDDKFTDSPSSLILANVTNSSDGIRFSKSNEKIYISTALTTDQLDKSSNTNNFKSLSLAFSYNPVNTEKLVIHTGLSSQIHKSNSSTDKQISYETGFDSAYGTSAINGSINTNIARVYGLNFGVISGPFSVQSEIIRNYNSYNGIPKSLFKGEYIQFLYSLTGESRQYDIKANGEFCAFEPKSNFSIKNGGTGAWELALRYNHLNMNSDASIYNSSTNSASVGKLGKMHTLTFGVNWYWNKNFNMKLNYIKGYSSTNSYGKGNKPESILLKAELSF